MAAVRFVTPTYFRLRSLSFEQVRDREAARIGGEPAFAGPRPDWVVDHGQRAPAYLRRAVFAEEFKLVTR
jgi:hypothetical protein